MVVSELSHGVSSVFAQVVRRDLDSVDPEEGGYYLTYRDLRSYNLLLPQHNGQTFLQSLEEKLQTSQEPITVLDVGCGQGVALAELVSIYPRVKAAGISATDLRQYAPERVQPFLTQVDFRAGDVHELNTLFGSQEKFDYVISAKTFEHLAHPDQVARHCQKLLKPGGLAFIEGPTYNRVLQAPLSR